MQIFAGSLKAGMPAPERHDPVLLLAGDCNLPSYLAEQGVAHLQPQDVANADEVWQVKTTTNDCLGDACFVKGCSVAVFEVEVGISYPEQGMRPDGHDALGIVLKLPLLHANF